LFTLINDFIIYLGNKVKKILVLVLIIAFSYLQAQDAHVLEFRINIKNNSSSKTILAKLENVNWAESWDANTSNFDEHDLKAFSPPNRTSNSNNTIGWNICWQPTGVTYTFGLANYKCSIYKDGTLSDYFYIDYRTSDLAEAYQSWNDDIDVYFNVINGKLYWNYSLTQLVGTGSEETIWDLSPNITQITTELEPYTVASFSVSGSTYPQLSWTHWPEGYRTGYAVYRSVVSGCGSQASAFTKIASLSANATSYTDYDFSVGGPITAYYKIRAVNGTRESEDSDIENICVGLYKDNKSYNSFDYSLDQNFPTLSILIQKSHIALRKLVLLV
jgi:hypothetical protein